MMRMISATRNGIVWRASVGTLSDTSVAQVRAQGIGEAEGERADGHAPGRPAHHDDDDQGDEAPPGGDGRLEHADQRRGDGGAAEAGQQAREQRGDRPHPDHVDAAGERRVRVLAHGPHLEAEDRPLRHPPHDRHQPEGQPRHPTVGEERLAQERDVRQAGDVDLAEDVHLAALAAQRRGEAEDVAGEADAQDRQPEADHDLVGVQADAQPHHQQRQRRAGQGARQQAQGDARLDGHVQRREGADDHEALQTDVQHAGPLGDGLAQGGEDERRRQAHASGDGGGPERQLGQLGHVRTPRARRAGRPGRPLRRHHGAPIPPRPPASRRPSAPPGGRWRRSGGRSGPRTPAG